MEGKVCLITGANSGIGKATALGLANLGARVLMLCRNEERGELARQEIIKASNNKSVELLICDLSSQKDIKRFIEDFKKKYQHLHVLINNAGIMLLKHHLTEEGIEMTFAVNYLAPFLLTNSLLDILKQSAPSRIIIVSSIVYKIGELNFDDLNLNENYGLFKAYAQSKLCLNLFTFQLSKRLVDTNVTVNCLHPGAINTNLLRDTPIHHLTKVLKKAKRGAKTSIFLASSPKVEGISGKYFVKKKEKKLKKKSRDDEIAKKLWDLSLNLVNEKF